MLAGVYVYRQADMQDIPSHRYTALRNVDTGQQDKKRTGWKCYTRQGYKYEVR